MDSRLWTWKLKVKLYLQVLMHKVREQSATMQVLFSKGAMTQKLRNTVCSNHTDKLQITHANTLVCLELKFTYQSLQIQTLSKPSHNILSSSPFCRIPNKNNQTILFQNLNLWCHKFISTTLLSSYHLLGMWRRGGLGFKMSTAWLSTYNSHMHLRPEWSKS